MKYIFVTGGVVSSLGKGLTAAALGTLLENRGLKVALQKFDPYLNVDPGTMSPYQHGEVYVLDDGAETDLDLGHYERFTNVKLTRLNNLTSGQVYQTVLNNEREGKYLGKTVQVIPHVTDEIKNRIHTLAEQSKADVVITEIGGTTGDIEGLPFLEAIREFALEVGYNNAIFVHVTYVPFIKAAGELKSKPTQQSIAKLREIGTTPHIIVCRCERMDDLVCNLLRLDAPAPNMAHWQEIIRKLIAPQHRVRIGVVGKYIELQDAYKSVYEAIIHGGVANDCGVEIMKVDAEDLERDGADKHLKGLGGILVPGGFGERGIEGKIEAARYAREANLPYLGLCLGMQIATIEFARNVLKLDKAHSTEFDPNTPHPVIGLLDEQKKITKKGGTMRLGAQPCQLVMGSMAAKLYGAFVINERHRHRYEFNNTYGERFQKADFVFSGHTPDGKLVEVIELPNHPFFIASQFHPEFRSKPHQPHPLFRGFIAAAHQRVHQK